MVVISYRYRHYILSMAPRTTGKRRKEGLWGRDMSAYALGAVKFLSEIMKIVAEPRAEALRLFPPPLKRRPRQQALLLCPHARGLVVRLGEEEVQMSESESVKSRLYGGREYPWTRGMNETLVAVLTLYFDARSASLASCCSNLVRMAWRCRGRSGRTSARDLIRPNRCSVL